MQAIKLLLVASILSIIPGQIIRFPIFSSSGAFTLTDIFVFLTNFAFFVFFIPIKKRFKLTPKIFLPASLFILIAALSTIISLTRFTTGEVIVSSLFLVRFTLYLTLAPIIANIVKTSEVFGWIKLIITTIVVYLIIGILQVIIFPDLSFLASYGWDPHQMRIVSTFLDPNFSGALFCILLAFSAALFLYRSQRVYLLISVFATVGIILTYSRSTYLDLIVVVAILGLFKSPKLFITSSIVFVLIFSQITRVRERVIGALTFDETAQARIESWNNAGKIITDNLLIGVGFNTYRYAQAQYGFFSTDDPFGGHSGGGVDSSFLLIFATTGALGLTAFLVFFVSVLKVYLKNIRKNYLSLGAFASMLGLSLNTQFINSFFFPQIMLVLWLILGLNLVHDN